MTDTIPPLPSPIILTIPELYPAPPFAIYTFLIWFGLVELDSPFSLKLIIWASVEVAQSLGTTTYSVESNFIISLGKTENKYFQIYPSPLVPAVEGSRSVNVGSSCDLFPFKFTSEDPLSIQI